MSASLQDRVLIAPARARRLLVAPFGRHTRYMLGNYARHTFVVTLVFLAIALTIDLSPRMSRLLLVEPAVGGLAAAGRVAWYSVLRSADILTRLFPIICFLGIAWSEIAHTRSRERIVIWNSGRAPAQCLMPVLLFGALAGALQISLDCYIRPAAVFTQIAARWGDFGEKLDRTLSQKVSWMAASDSLVSARVEYGPPPVLHEPTVYRFDAQGRLIEVITARTASPAETLGRWQLRNARAWDVEASRRGSSNEAASTAPDDGALVEEREIALALDPLWVSYLNVYPKVLPQDVLLALAQPHSDMYPSGPYQAWKQIRYAQALLPGTMAVLGFALSVLFLAIYGARVQALLGISLAGYLAHLLIKVVVFLGEHEHIRPMTSAWFAPLLLLAISAGILWAIGVRNFGGAHARA